MVKQTGKDLAASRDAWKEEMEREQKLREQKWEEQKRINTKLFQYHDVHQSEIRELLVELKTGGLAIHECPMGIRQK
jgi:hypothetical protein